MSKHSEMSAHEAITFLKGDPGRIVVDGDGDRWRYCFLANGTETEAWIEQGRWELDLLKEEYEPYTVVSWGKEDEGPAQEEGGKGNIKNLDGEIEMSVRRLVEVTIIDPRKEQKDVVKALVYSERIVTELRDDNIKHEIEFKKIIDGYNKASGVKEPLSLDDAKVFVVNIASTNVIESE